MGKCELGNLCVHPVLRDPSQPWSSHFQGFDSDLHVLPLCILSLPTLELTVWLKLLLCCYLLHLLLMKKEKVCDRFAL